MFTDAETVPAKEMFLLAIKGKCFWPLDKKNDPYEKNIPSGYSYGTRTPEVYLLFIRDQVCVIKDVNIVHRGVR